MLIACIPNLPKTPSNIRVQYNIQQNSSGRLHCHKIYHGQPHNFVLSFLYFYRNSFRGRDFALLLQFIHIPLKLGGHIEGPVKISP